MRPELIRVAGGAGFAGDRPLHAKRLAMSLARWAEATQNTGYLVLEGLAERTLALRWKDRLQQKPGFDPRWREWADTFLPVIGQLKRNQQGNGESQQRGKARLRVVTSFGAADPESAARQTATWAAQNNIPLRVAAVHENLSHASTYLGADAIIKGLDTDADVIITGRVADAALFLAPMVHEFGWDISSHATCVAQGLAIGHLLECGTQVSGGFFWHSDGWRDSAFDSHKPYVPRLPIAEIHSDGTSILGAVAGNSEFSLRTCAQQLLYEVHDPKCYMTPDLAVDFSHVHFRNRTRDLIEVIGAQPRFVPSHLLRLHARPACFRGWGEISYIGLNSAKRARVADSLVRMWLRERYPNSDFRIMTSFVGPRTEVTNAESVGSRHLEFFQETRLHMDGIFQTVDEAKALCEEVDALYTNGPAGGGGVRGGFNEEIELDREFVDRNTIDFRVSVFDSGVKDNDGCAKVENNACKLDTNTKWDAIEDIPNWRQIEDATADSIAAEGTTKAAPSSIPLPLYHVCHSRAGDKGDRSNISLIPHHAPDIERIARIVTPDWVASRFSQLITKNPPSVQVYRSPGVHALNIVIDDVLDGGVCKSRRLDRHGKTLSDYLLSQNIVLSD